MSDRRADLREVVIPFIIFTLIWGSTWLVIRSQLEPVPPQWSVTYRFLIAASGMAVLARVKRQSLALGWRHAGDILLLGFAQFCVNFNAVYFAERFITSGVVATVFALLLIPSSLLGWAFLGQKPGARFLWGSLVAVAGVALLFVHEVGEDGLSGAAAVAGIGATLIGMVGASSANVFQALPRMRHLPLFSMLAWSMAAGAMIDGAIAFAVAGPPRLTADPLYWAGLAYLALFASVIAFSLYYPVVRKIGPARAAYSSMIVPIIAMALSTMFENYRWTLTTVGGAALVMAGMALALSRGKTKLAPPDAA